MSRATNSLEVVPGVHRIRTDYQDRYLFQHVLVGSHTVLIVDAGVPETPPEHLFPFLDGLVSTHEFQLLISHCDADHCGGAAALQRRYPRLLTLAHTLDAPLISDPERNLAQRYQEMEGCGVAYSPERQALLLANLGEPPRIDRLLVGGERLVLSDEWYVDLIHAPGHTAGHMAVWDASSAVAVITDACLGSAVPTREGHPAFAPTYRYTKPYRDTIATVRELSATLLLTSHFPLIERADVGVFLDASADFTFAVERFLLRELGRGVVTLPSLIGAVGSAIGDWPQERNMELWYCFQGGLETLADRSLATNDGCEWRLSA